ncbi:MAG: chloride channel protein [Chromatiaceae bacterium]|nr:chloride channel protein [Chromatiaceae bacterium]
MRRKLSVRIGELLDRHRLRLAHPNALLQLALLGLLTGLLAGAVILLFRLAVEGAQSAFLPDGLPENYEMLPVWFRVLLPILGGVAIGLIFLRFSGGLYLLGVARVMERMSYHQGYLTLRGFLLQFVGAAMAIISGHSVGREGPHVYLGAASGSLLGQYLRLPNNCIRTLVGCGAAAAISASFNTPLAGVIFALELVMMEYTLASFIPVMLAAASANAVSVMVLGSEPAFQIPELHLGTLKEMPLVVLLGVVAGSLSALFVHLLQSLSQLVQKWPFWLRTSCAGVAVGALATLMPQVMGIGYDTVNSALLGEIGYSVLALLLLFKMLATTASVGMGIPGGMIGPALFMGSILGSLFAQIANMLLPDAGFDVGFYAVLGMGAMMGASIQAPLAALTAMIELTFSPQIVMPGMLAVVIAGLTASELFGKESIFSAVLKAAGMDYNADPVTQALRRIGVASVMQRNYARTGAQLSREDARDLLEKEPVWLLVYREHEPIALMQAVDLVRYLQDADSELTEDMRIDLMVIPGQRFEVAGVNLQANLQEALEILNRKGVDALYVERMTVPGINRIYGVLTRHSVENSYRYQEDRVPGLMP